MKMRNILFYRWLLVVFVSSGIVMAEDIDPSATKPLDLILGKDHVEYIDFAPHTMLQISRSDILDVIMVPAKREILFRPKGPGETTVFIRNMVGDIRARYNVRVGVSNESNIVKNTEDAKQIDAVLGRDQVEYVDFAPHTKAQISRAEILDVIMVPGKREILFRPKGLGETTVFIRNTVGDISARYNVRVSASNESKIAEGHNAIKEEQVKQKRIELILGQEKTEHVDFPLPRDPKYVSVSNKGIAQVTFNTTRKEIIFSPKVLGETSIAIRNENGGLCAIFAVTVQPDIKEAQKEADRNRKVAALASSKNYYIKKDWYRAIIRLEEFLKLKDMDEDLVTEATKMMKYSKEQLKLLVDPLLGKARSLKEGKDLKGAYETYNQILQFDPDNEEAMNEMNMIREMFK